jgi:hypothetical protein
MSRAIRALFDAEINPALADLYEADTISIPAKVNFAD